MSSSRRDPAWRRLVLGCAWTLLVIGLLAMHGLGTHGAGRHSVSDTTTIHAPAGVRGADEAGTADMPALAMREADERTPTRQDPFGSLTAMCLAVLGSLLLARCGIRITHSQRESRRVTSRQWPPYAFQPTRGLRDPPALRMLSVIRC